MIRLRSAAVKELTSGGISKDHLYDRCRPESCNNFPFIAQQVKT